jgi:hypothetical protein
LSSKPPQFRDGLTVKGNLMENYDHMLDDVERDLVFYIMGLWHQRRIQAYLKRK